MATNRGHEVAQDQLDAVQWSCVHPWYMIITDDAGTVGELNGPVSVISSEVPSQKNLSGFKNHEAIMHALDAGIEFEAVLCIDDDCLPIGVGLDRWGLEQVVGRACDLVGVCDRACYDRAWEAERPLLESLVPEARGRPAPGVTMFYGISWMSRFLVDELARRELLLPAGYEEWKYWPDVYISWMAHALGCETYLHGSMDRPRPPLYANHPRTMKYAPQPMILHPDFLAFHSTKAVPAVPEPEVRQFYADVRKSQ